MGPHISGKGNTNHNETAHAAARDLTNRTAAEVDTDTSESYNAGKEPMTTYSEIVTWYGLSRRTVPPPHPGLTIRWCWPNSSGSSPLPTTTNILCPYTNPCPIRMPRGVRNGHLPPMSRPESYTGSHLMAMQQRSNGNNAS
ncbi:hypothetical protein HPB48_015970 [Haemaphysalis longicornis]|uniref:Uncharacterized protein n=1 Tax=Haemaphysalis longicornis TaxID=44386 RepID=A0A9J6G890_HAELO|nr:hypothetical protein HPB48_015970 [Haemaphysalis longicornis]